ncbi:MAG: hypothetical protein B7Z08_10695 [Sphingomonadales bacterium 32-68-7]|nr:MAG: hypothetical protein B7Z33_12550 [Sphingomonadales bacterium 12-68-11]OYX08137.1 MAG: hypothetical protein B7Z08_10695 [Sphingomonadales bacterium 32-68-7]
MKRPAMLTAFVLLGACQTAAPGDYPSLAVRDAERITGTLAPPPPYRPPPALPAVIGDLARLGAEVAGAQDAFAVAAPAARNAVEAARGSAAGSESWARAHIAVASLESARSRALVALADLDRLYATAATEGTELTPIASARESAALTVDDQTATITALLGMLG